MTRYLIQEVRYDYDRQPAGMLSPQVVQVRYSCGNTSKWILMDDFDDHCQHYLSDEDISRIIIDADVDVETFNSYIIKEFNGLELGDYQETIFSLYKNPDNPQVPLLKYMMAVIDSPFEEIDDLIKTAVGRYADELDIPESDHYKGILRWVTSQEGL